MTDWSLAGLQHWFQKALHNPRAVDDVDAIFEATPGLDAGQGLAIYQRSYYLRLTKCLQDQFPALNYALGADLFFDFAQEYIHAMPSESYTLYRLGERFSQYLNAERPDRDKSAAHREPWIDFMVELADFEWQLFSLFDAAGHEFGDWPNEATDYPDDKLRAIAIAKNRAPRRTPGTRGSSSRTRGWSWRTVARRKGGAGRAHRPAPRRDAGDRGGKRVRQDHRGADCIGC